MATIEDIFTSKNRKRIREAVETLDEALCNIDEQAANMKTWSLYTFDFQTNKFKRVMDGLSKRYAMLLVRRWKAGKMNCVLFAWPEWVPEPIGIEINGYPQSRMVDGTDEVRKRSALLDCK